MEDELEVKDPVENTEEPTNKTSVEESILLSIKKLLGILETDTNFDTDIIININSVFSTLRQLGVGPKDGYRITDAENKWSEFIQDYKQLDFVKTYIYLKVKLVFDPPLNGSLMESFKQSIQELEWRLNIAVETDEEEVEDE